MKRLIASFLVAFSLLAQPALATDRKPLVIINGATKQMPAGDTVGVDVGGTGGTTASAARTGLNVYSTSEVDAAISTVAGSGTGTPSNGVVSGCGVAYSGTGLGFGMSACSARINGSLVSGAAQTVTLSAADATNPRIDVLYVDDTGTFGKITGTPAATPSTPTVDPTSQLYLAYALVPATATSLSGYTTTLQYDEGVEWTCTGSGITCGSTSNPNSGTKDIEATTISAGSYVKLVAGSPISFDGDGSEIIGIRSKGTWNTKRSLIAQYYLSGVAKGSPVTIKDGSFGFVSATTGSYQTLVVSKSLFAVPAGTNIDEFRLTASGTGGTLGFYLDPIKLQTVTSGSGGTGGGTTSGITQDQADARYLKLTGGSMSGNLAVNVTGSTQCLHVNSSGVISGMGSDCGTSSSSGTVTTVSVASANGFAGSVATASTTPAITLTTSITGVLKGNGTAISAASAGTDYLAPAAIGSTVQAYDADLGALGGVTSAADKCPYFTGSATASVVTCSSAGRTLMTNGYVTEAFCVAASDESTAITTGTAKVTFRMPYAFTLTAVRASLNTVSSSGIPAFDLNEAGASVFSTTLTIDASEKTSTTAATAAVISDSSLADDAEMTIDIDTAGTGAKGAKLCLIGHQ